MAKNADIEFFNFMNMDDTFKRYGLTLAGDELRYIKDIIATKVSMFQYDGLPEGLTSEILERALMFTNFLCFYKSDEYGLILAKYRSNSVYNLYWKPLTVNIQALNGTPIAYNVPYEDIVLVRDNSLDIPPFLTTRHWIDRIMDKEKTLDCLIKWGRVPAILTGDKEQTAALKQVIKKAIDADPFAIGSKNFKDHLEQFDVTLPLDITKVYELMDKYHNMALASIGIYSVDVKRERIVTSEIMANNDYVDFVYTAMYDERKRFVEECNSRFGTNIKLREIYVENQEDNIKLTEDTAIAKEAGKVEVQKVENEGNIEVAKVESKGEKNND